DRNVTGVQTCALPIFLEAIPAQVSAATRRDRYLCGGAGVGAGHHGAHLGQTAGDRSSGVAQPVNGGRATILKGYHGTDGALLVRSEERRVGKEGRARW